MLFAGLLMPIFNVTRLGSQIVGARLIGTAPVTKWYLALSTLVTAVALAVLALVWSGIPPIWLAAIFLVTACVLGSSGGLGALAFQDMLGRALPTRYRGDLLFAQAAITGVIAAGLGLLAYFATGSQKAGPMHAELIWAGLGMTLLAAITVVAVREPVKRPPHHGDATAGKAAGKSYFAELSDGLRMVSKLKWFQRYMIARLLFLSVEIVMPFFAVHAASFHGDMNISLSMFVVASSIGLVLGGIVWPRVGKKSMQLVMAAAALVAFVAALLALANHLDPALRWPLTYAVIFVLLAVAAQGVSSARTVYLVDSATDAERPYCVAVSNAAVGLAGLGMAFAVGSISEVCGVIWGLLIMAGLNIAAAVYVRKLTVVHHADEPQDDPTGATLATVGQEAQSQS